MAYTAETITLTGGSVPVNYASIIRSLADNNITATGTSTLTITLAGVATRRQWHKLWQVAHAAGAKLTYTPSTNV